MGGEAQELILSAQVKRSAEGCKGDTLESLITPLLVHQSHNQLFAVSLCVASTMCFAQALLSHLDPEPAAHVLRMVVLYQPHLTTHLTNRELAKDVDQSRLLDDSHHLCYSRCST